LAAADFAVALARVLSRSSMRDLTRRAPASNPGIFATDLLDPGLLTSAS
jgi:hypothetical protein